MDAGQAIAIVVRWVHIASAMAALGGPFFVRFALMPAAGKVLDEASHQKLREAINARWRHFVYGLITLFLATGLYTFFVVARWKTMPADQQRIYHMVFGIKMVAAFGIFLLASALAGRSETFAPVRKRAGLFIGVLLILGVVLLACSNVLRMLPFQ